jgi:serine/threonine protein kinase
LNMMLGASRAVSEKTSNKYTTGIGTPIYMAPEMLRREPYDLSSDIYGYIYNTYIWNFFDLFHKHLCSFLMSELSKYVTFFLQFWYDVVGVDGRKRTLVRIHSRMGNCQYRD